jgi:hypothetical protein
MVEEVYLAVFSGTAYQEPMHPCDAKRMPDTEPSFAKQA